jgi:DEAD/DEAH box helicase domain-containing protein
MGGIHAVEHALIGLFPLLAISDRGDVGGISHTGHPQLRGPGIFIYDGTPGGAGLAEQGYRDLESLLRKTLEHLIACSCEDGCPGCIHSPRCGNGNRPLDKAASILVLQGVLGMADLPKLEQVTEESLQHEPAEPEIAPRKRHGIIRAPERARTGSGKVLVMDLETRRSAEEVGGWGNADRMGLAVAVVYDVGRQDYRTYFEEDVDRLLLDLLTADRVIGFNLDRFDLKVLSGYTDGDLGRIRTCDLLAHVHERLGFRLSLQHLSDVNLGESKSGNGLQSLQWWREGKVDLIESYCRKDVEMTCRLWEIGRSRGYLLYKDKRDRILRIPADW